MDVKITFNTTTEQIAKQQNERQHTGRTGKAVSAHEASFLSRADKTWESGRKKSLMELQQDAESADVSAQQDYMTVMSHTMSQEDYAQMEKEGFDFASIDPETAVTIVDKIKAELVRSGQHIAGYTDDIDLDTLAAAVGSDALARAISGSFQEADIPLTPENVESVRQAWNMASQLGPMQEGTERYLIDNGMEPEIRNVYLAQNSGAESMTNSAPRYYAEEIQGYYTESAEGADEQSVLAQIDKVIEKAGFAVDEESRAMGKWLLEKGIPLTEENLQRLGDLNGVSLPLTEESFAEAAANAIAAGKEPIHANLAGTDNIYRKAAEVLERYQNMEESIAGQDITARRQLEEIRLRMTAEANVKLLKSGFAIDTAPMEQLLEALKEVEAQLAERYFPNDEQAVAKYQGYNAANRIMEELPGLPAQVLGPWSTLQEQSDLSEFYAQGKTLQESYEKAQSSYEALMTAPRSDMGDSIQKAFANVDAILEDLGLELTAKNRRAVRILGYNRMDMTPENIEQVKAADARVQFVIEKMTPAATLQMIRDGVNPLEKTLPELEQYFEALPEEYQERAESYSRFLYGLEKNQAVTEEERQAYIGVYRLLRQIEKSDGAAVGALVHSQAQLHLNNLLSAVRSGKFKHMDVKVTDRLGTVSERISQGESISEQIAKAFVKDAESILTEVSYNEETMEAYGQERLAQLRRAAATDAQCIALLQRGQVPANAENLLAAQALTQGEGIWGELLKRKTKETTEMSENLQEVAKRAEGLWEDLDDKEAFCKSYEKVTQDASAAVEAVTEQEADTGVDVRGLRLMHRQLGLAGSLARQEEYFLSMNIGGELTEIHLTVEKGTEEKGRVQVTCRFSGEEELTADFRLEDHKITAALAGNEKAEVTKLQKIADTFTEEASARWTVEKVSVTKNAGHAPQILGNQEKSTSGDDFRVDNAELYRVAKIFLQAVRQ